MSKIEEQNSGKKEGEIRYLTPLNIDTSVQKKYCRFKKSGIKFVDYKDPNLSFIYILFRNITGVGGFILPIIAIAAFFNFLDILIFIYSIIYFLTFVLYCISYYRKLN